MQEQILSNVENVKIGAAVDDDGNLVATVKFQCATSPFALARLVHFVKSGGALTCAFQTPQLAFDLLLTEVKPVDARPAQPGPEAKKKAKVSDNGKGTAKAAAEAVDAPAPEPEPKDKQPA